MIVVRGFSLPANGLSRSGGESPLKERLRPVLRARYVTRRQRHCSLQTRVAVWARSAQPIKGRVRVIQITQEMIERTILEGDHYDMIDGSHRAPQAVANPRAHPCAWQPARQARAAVNKNRFRFFRRRQTRGLEHSTTEPDGHVSNWSAGCDGRDSALPGGESARDARTTREGSARG